MYDTYYIIVWKDGTEEKVYASIEVRNNLLYITEHFGITHGIKSQRIIPLTSIKEWRTAE